DPSVMRQPTLPNGASPDLRPLAVLGEARGRMDERNRHATQRWNGAQRNDVAFIGKRLGHQTRRFVAGHLLFERTIHPMRPSSLLASRESKRNAELAL